MWSCQTDGSLCGYLEILYFEFDEVEFGDNLKLSLGDYLFGEKGSNGYLMTSGGGYGLEC